jgi:hypothetical protein
MMMNRRGQNIHASRRIRTHGLSVQAIKAYASDRAATGIGRKCHVFYEPENENSKEAGITYQKRLPSWQIPNGRSEHLL